ncbi:MAG: dihydroorotate dehydrogenase electron transfer subunit [Dehalobacterium sp.]
MMQMSANILSNIYMGSGFYYMEIEAREVANEAVPGQFLHVKVNEGLYPLLRRPMSLHEIDREKDILGLLYQVRGKGTEILSGRIPGSKIDIMGPLGKGFTLNFPGQYGVIVGGGIGVAPLLSLAKELRKLEKEVTVILGARSAQFVLTEAKFISLGCQVLVTTDDGSKGRKGRATGLLAEHIKNKQVDFLYACGPEGMLEEVQKISLLYKIKGEISLEAYMGCGVGACLSCSCERSDISEKRYAKVCTDGPVFSIGEVKILDR